MGIEIDTELLEVLINAKQFVTSANRIGPAGLRLVQSLERQIRCLAPVEATESIAILATYRFADAELLNRVLSHYVPCGLRCIVAGEHNLVAKQFAEAMGLQFAPVIVDWDGKGRQAGVLASIDMLDAADAAICFWSDDFSGSDCKMATAALKLAERCHKPILLVEFPTA